MADQNGLARSEPENRGANDDGPIARAVWAYLASSFAAGLTLGVQSLLLELGNGRTFALAQRPGASLGIYLMAVLLHFAFFGGIVTAALAWMPAIGFIVFGLRTGMRSVLYYAGAGVFAGVFCSSLLAYLGGGFTASWMRSVLPQFLSPGLLAGVVYWAVASRHASEAGRPLSG